MLTDERQPSILFGGVQTGDVKDVPDVPAVSGYQTGVILR